MNFPSGVTLLVFKINTKENQSLCVHTLICYALVTLNCILKIAPGSCQIPVNQAQFWNRSCPWFPPAYFKAWSHPNFSPKSWDFYYGSRSLSSWKYFHDIMLVWKINSWQFVCWWNNHQICPNRILTHRNSNIIVATCVSAKLWKSKSCTAHKLSNFRFYWKFRNSLILHN